MQTEKQRERLVELLLKCDKESEVLDCFNERPKKTQSAELIADYLMSNNVVVLPFSVGLKVYFISEWTDEEAIEGSLVSYSVDERGIWFYCRYLCGLSMWHKIDDVGKTVFLSRAEAENVLKERNNAD